MTDKLNIKMLVMDVDGVLTDGGIIYDSCGNESKRFNVHDGAWLKIWQRLGLQTAVITGRQSVAVDRRMTELGIDFVYQNAKVKIGVFENLVKESGINPQEMAYIGDDVMDLPVLRRVGYAVTVPDAIDEVKSHCDYITKKTGGSGAVGELIVSMIKAMGMFDKAMERYLA
ncbi:MAG: HAD-IIIA family hydrolase [Phycisphaerae bacterium]|nr:HAD-IIIA family hydrolase [Phycisphaerae bacterium]